VVFVAAVVSDWRGYGEHKIVGKGEGGVMIDLDELERLDKVTAASWQDFWGGEPCCVGSVPGIGGLGYATIADFRHREDALAAVAFRNAIPQLLRIALDAKAMDATIQQLQADLEEALEALKPSLPFAVSGVQVVVQ
jgi:hypothetical protein